VAGRHRFRDGARRARPVERPAVERPRRARRALAVAAEYRGVGSQSLVALLFNSATSLVAGAVLGSLTDTFERLPGLLVLVPAAIGLRGNVFSALGSRLSTSIHTGTFRLTLRAGTVVGDNVRASLLLTSAFSLLLAVVGKAFAVAFGVADTISLFDLVTISVVGGLLASVVVLASSLGLAAAARRRDWDLDNLVAPITSTLGDVLTLPALWVGTLVIGHGLVTGVVGTIALAIGVASLVAGLLVRRPLLRSIVRQSGPVLLAAVVLSTLAGLAIESRLDLFATYPAFLVLLPAFVSSAGALGGIQASRLATQLHLGTVVAGRMPGRPARLDGALVATLAVPIYLVNGAGAHAVAGVIGAASPGLAAMLATAVLGAVGLVLFVLVVAYYGSVAAYRFGLDPDTYGIPVVTSSVDFVGAVALIAVAVVLGFT
jgi:mgtE-like transporter